MPWTCGIIREVQMTFVVFKQALYLMCKFPLLPSIVDTKFIGCIKSTYQHLLVELKIGEHNLFSIVAMLSGYKHMGVI